MDTGIRLLKLRSGFVFLKSVFEQFRATFLQIGKVKVYGWSDAVLWFFNHSCDIWKRIGKIWNYSRFFLLWFGTYEEREIILSRWQVMNGVYLWGHDNATIGIGFAQLV